MRTPMRLPIYMDPRLRPLYDLLGVFQPQVGHYYPSVQIGWEWSEDWIDIDADRFAAVYYPIFRSFRADRIGLHITGAGAAGARCRVGLYTDENFAPNTLVVDSGELDASSTGLKEAAIDITCDVGRYWTVYLGNDSTIDVAGGFILPLGFSDIQRAYTAREVAGLAYGPLPETAPATWWMDWAPTLRIMLRVAEIL